MAGSIQLKKGTKMQLAFDVPVGQEPQFNMLCTFNKALDESAFLVSDPMVDGKRLVPDESQKLLFKYTEGEDSNILAGYVDDVVKEGIRHYLKVRMKVELPITYMQDTWELNSEGEVDKEKGQTMDISNNGLAVYMNRWFEVGESCIFTLPRLGTAAEGQPAREVVGVICWTREMPKGSPFRFVAGIQLRFADQQECQDMQDYVAYVKKRYKL